MIRRLTLMALAFTAVAASAQAQVAPPHVGPGVDPPRYQADQHHQEIDRLRARADQREAFTRRLEVETRLSRLEIEAARQTDLALPPPYRALRSPEEERALRESATARRRDTTAGVEQVDAWLDRPAR